MVLHSSKNSLAIIIPMFNEEKVAAKSIDEVIKVLRALPNKTALIVVNDGSKDKTAKILQEKVKQYPKHLVVITHKQNKGYGGASQTGMKQALELQYEWCLHMDSDLTNDPKYIATFIRYMSDKYDCIKASRYIKGGKVLHVPVYRRVISSIGNTVASALFGIGVKDCTNGFRMVRVSLLDGIEFKENNFSIILEELYYLKKRHARFIEIPNTLTARVDSQSHFSYKPRIFYDYFKYLIKSFFVV